MAVKTSGLVMAVFALVTTLSVQAAPGRAAAVVTAEAREVAMAASVNVPGTVVSLEQAVVPAEVTGRLTWVAEVGSVVKAGEAVARVDDRLYTLQVAEQKAAVARETARLAFLEDEFKRIQALSAEAVASASDVDKTRRDLQVARGELELARARLALNEETLRRYVIRAPFDGVVMERRRHNGEWVAVGNDVVVVSNPVRLEIVAQVGSDSVSFLNGGSAIEVSSLGRRQRLPVSAVVPVGDAQSRLYTLRVGPLNGLSWRAGESVELRVPVAAARQVLAVPRDALVMRRTGVSVYRVVDGKAERLAVTTGIANGDLIEVSGGLRAGDQVVVRGGERLRPGQDVKQMAGSL